MVSECTGIVKLTSPRITPVIHHLELQSPGCAKVVEILEDGLSEDRMRTKLETWLREGRWSGAEWRPGAQSHLETWFNFWKIIEESVDLLTGWAVAKSSSENSRRATHCT